MCRKLVLAILLLPVFVSVAAACSCMSVSPCEAYGLATVAFVGVVTKTTAESTDKPVALLKVEKTFGQALSETVEIYGGGTTCDLPFKTGERYLVYAYQDANTKTLSTNICSGSTLLAQANDHLTYLDGAVSASGGVVSGQVWQERTGKTQPLAGAEVTFVNGDRTFRGKTDGAGKFTVTSLPQGRYKVHTNPRTNHSHLDVMAKEPVSEWELELSGHGCVNTWFAARPEGEIAGTITDESGIVPDDLELQLIPADADAGGNGVVSLREFASFKFSFVPPGRYYLGFNLKSGPSLHSPYPTFYYPGVAERSAAKIITLAEDQKITNLFVSRPLRLGERILEGIAVWPNGKPYVQECGIQIANPKSGYREGNCVWPDAQGRFKIRALEGQTYYLSATLRQPGSFQLIRSKPLTVTTGNGNKPVRLVVRRP